MKQLSKLLLSTCLFVGPLCGELIDVSPDGSSYRDRYGADWTPKQKAPHPWEIDPGPGKCLAGLSKKKTSDIVIYPTPRGY